MHRWSYDGQPRLNATARLPELATLISPGNRCMAGLAALLGWRQGVGRGDPTVTRVAMLVGALAVIGGVLSGCGEEPAPGAAPDMPPAPTSTTIPPSSPAAGPSSPATTPAGPKARILTLTVSGGKASGDTDRVVVPLGTPVTINVTSDAADEIHVHGYDAGARIPAGGTGSVAFIADIPGVFEVELHESGLQLLQLQVS
ncbi:MAG: hypothetical protein LC799_20870 [Actinobacteria bacterium]|nr:hypothetical protein [Actinomycetota bacterium]